MYSAVCPNCGEKSEQEVQYCPACGFEKSEIVTRTGFFNSINDTLVKKLDFLDYPQLYVTVITRLVIMLFIIFVIPDFISDSEFFWMLIGIFSVYGLIKEIARTYKGVILIYKISRTLLFAYFGAGIGNLIAHAGRMTHYNFSYYFNIVFIFNQISAGNTMIFVGAIAGIIVMLLYNRFRDDFKYEE